MNTLPNIVLATDGSELSEISVTPVLKLAKQLGARVIFVRVTEPQTLTAVDGMLMPYPREEIEGLIDQAVKKQFARLAVRAEIERVAAESRHVKHAQPWRGILYVAEDVEPMMIAITSHGHGGIGSLLIGSQTQKILAHSKIPVIVYR
jgi:nucleotide-binding universal stress UspA family protein